MGVRHGQMTLVRDGTSAALRWFFPALVRRFVAHAPLCLFITERNTCNDSRYRQLRLMLLCSSLVMLMTPGWHSSTAALLGQERSRNYDSKFCFRLDNRDMVCVRLLNVFSGDVQGIVGNLDMAFLRGVNLTAPSPINSSIPLIVFVAYQMMFAIITPALITGAFANRVTFKAYMLFLTDGDFRVFPFVHMVWGNGILQKWGVLDLPAALRA